MLRRRSAGSLLLVPVLFANTLGERSSVAQTSSDREKVMSLLQTIGVEDGAQPVTVYRKQGYLEAPNWTRDGASLIFDAGGQMFRISVHGGEPEMIPTGTATHCNGSHGLSPDGKSLAITCTMPELPGARVYLVPVAGGTPRVVTQNPSSYFHSWSPDGKTIAFTRPDRGSGNIFSISVDGGKETALTTGTGISDDPDYSPDGKYIYFNSDRGGTMQIWRMHPDDSAPEQMTEDALVNWTPHVSPDGRLVVFLSYEHGVTGHPSNRDVSLRLMSLPDRRVRVLTRLVGGSGTMNVPSWAPDSRRFAFVAYEVPTANEK